MATPYSDTMKYLRDAPDDFTLSFKPPTSKVANNRNMLSHCEYALCRIEEYHRGPKFSVCSSCRVRRYCVSDFRICPYPVTFLLYSVESGTPNC